MIHPDDEGAEVLGALLRDRVQEIHPDLERRAASAIRTGTWILRRRRAAATTATLACAGSAAVVGAQLVTSPDAGGSSHEASALGASADGTARTSCEQQEREWKRMTIESLDPSAFPSDGDAANTVPGTSAPQTVLTPGTPGTMPISCPEPMTAPPEELSVSLDSPGWRCTEPADEKFSCRKGSAEALVTVRAGWTRPDYLTDPDKAAPDQYVSELHRGKFATVLRIRGDVDVAELGEQLVWK